MDRYSGLIVCKKCGKNFKVKKERGKIKYVCSGYERYGKDFCVRSAVNESELDYMVYTKFREKYDDNQVREYVSIIEVEDKTITINYKNAEPSIISPYLIQF